MEVVAEERVFVRRQVDPVRIGAQMRVVAEARVGVRRQSRLPVGGNAGAVVVRGSLSTVILDRYAVDRPGAGRIPRLADGEIEVVGAGEIATTNVVSGIIHRVHIDGQDVGEPAVRRHVVVAARVGDERPEDVLRRIRLSDDLRRVAEEGVEIRRPLHRSARRVVDFHHVVDDLHLDAVADAQALVRRLERELVATVGQALIAMLQAVERTQDRQWPATVHALPGGHRDDVDARSAMGDRAASIDTVTPADARRARAVTQSRPELVLLNAVIGARGRRLE